MLRAAKMRSHRSSSSHLFCVPRTQPIRERSRSGCYLRSIPFRRVTETVLRAVGVVASLPFISICQSSVGLSARRYLSGAVADSAYSHPTVLLIWGATQS
ncbi:hypothetical protein MRX96_012301 [Rhipicephalus microplus]